MGQRQRDSKGRGSAMNDETAFDGLFWSDTSGDSRLSALQQNLIAFETKAMTAIGRFLPRPIAGIIKKKSGL